MQHIRLTIWLYICPRLRRETKNNHIAEHEICIDCDSEIAKALSQEGHVEVPICGMIGSRIARDDRGFIIKAELPDDGTEEKISELQKTGEWNFFERECRTYGIPLVARAEEVGVVS